MPDFSIIGWISIIGLVLLFASIFVAQIADSRRNKALFDLANIMTLVGFVGVVIGLISWLFG